MDFPTKRIVLALWVSQLPVCLGLGQTGNTVQSAISVLQSQADDGNIVAQAKLGYEYLFGDGVPKDPALAFKWSYRAAVAGNSLAAKDVCAAYFIGGGVSQNKQAGFEWCWIAANHDDPIAQRNLVSLYRNGVGVDKDIALAYAWAVIRRNTGDKGKRIPPILDALEKEINADQRSEAVALAAGWGKNKEHVMPVHSRWYLDNVPQNEDAKVKL